MSRIPLSDESDVELDDEIINDDVGTTGAEEQYAELDFDADALSEYEPEPFADDEFDWLEDDGDTDDYAVDDVTGRVK